MRSEEFHKLLAKQVKKYLPGDTAELPDVKAFIASVNASYLAFERDKEIATHAFSLSENEYRELYENLLRENELKKLSIEKLKEALQDIGKAGDAALDLDNENLLSITDYLKAEISKRKLAQAALEQSEEQYRNIVENSSDIIYKTTVTGHFTYVNPVAERLTDYTREELLGMQYTELIRPDKVEECVTFYQDQLAQKKLSTYYEFPIITKTGEEKWVGQSVQLTLQDNKPEEFTALAIDITVRKQYERNLQLQKEKYLSIITNMNLGLLEVDKDENILYANPGFSALSGYAEEELVGLKASDLFVRFNKDMMREKIRQRMKGVSDMYEMLVLNKRGEPRWWMISGAPNYDEKGSTIGSIGIHLDITEKKKLEKDLEIAKEKAEAEAKAKAAFLANMSHEIRTPLNGIIGMIRELTYENLDEKQRHYVQNAAVASEHLLSVLNNVLDISKIEADELSLDHHHFLLRSVLQDIKSIMSENARKKGILLGIDAQKLDGLVYVGDAARLRQILLNLVGNAIKFTSAGGVYLDCEIEKESATTHAITFLIEDTGIGMDEAYQANLFKKFSQEDSTVSRKYGGTGLGMAITKELIQLMHGEIRVSSQKHKGTRIYVSFRMPVGNIKEVEEVAQPVAQGDSSNARVLLVEDNRFNRLVARNTLERYGYMLDEAENGKIAIDLLKKNNYNIILMDLQMPEMDGFEATVEIRNTLKLQTPIIALTANAFKSELEKCQSLGMNEYVTKPYDEAKLMGVIMRLMRHETRPDTYHEEKEDGPAEESPQLYDLSILRRQSPGNPDYVIKMVNVFIDQTQQILPELREAYKQKDLEKVARFSHRIKPSIDGMGIGSLKNVVRTIEETARSGEDSEELALQVDLLCTTLDTIILELAKEQNG